MSYRYLILITKFQIDNIIILVNFTFLVFIFNLFKFKFILHPVLLGFVFCFSCVAVSLS